MEYLFTRLLVTRLFVYSFTRLWDSELNLDMDLDMDMDMDMDLIYEHEHEYDTTYNWYWYTGICDTHSP